ncbi:MAG: hypothetical protein HY834_03595 [Devosia nanyangense]|uniref:Uncharacterized protein n=1 Tax=Devosia nanyangense TaxID=1228055 RepID=A0A933L088_9HYPH|nr:hypothetical protein [Devosia nanyangense]
MWRLLALLVLLVLLVLLATRALGADWSHYDNARFGYGIDVPPGFAGRGEAENGDGQVFTTPVATLTVFGGYIMAADFEAEVKQRRDWAAAEGWALTYQVTTPDRASFSGRHGARILYARMIALCGGTAFGMFELEYSVADIQPFDPVVTRLVQSLRASGDCP